MGGGGGGGGGGEGGLEGAGRAKKKKKLRPCMLRPAFQKEKNLSLILFSL